MPIGGAANARLLIWPNADLAGDKGSAGNGRFLGGVRMWGAPIASRLAIEATDVYGDLHS
eukprot:6230664-Heterocapsa_arctica.AAC.1